MRIVVLNVVNGRAGRESVISCDAPHDFIDGSLDAFARQIVNKRSTIIEVLTRLLFWQPADRQEPKDRFAHIPRTGVWRWLAGGAAQLGGRHVDASATTLMTANSPCRPSHGVFVGGGD